MKSLSFRLDVEEQLPSAYSKNKKLFMYIKKAKNKKIVLHIEKAKNKKLFCISKKQKTKKLFMHTL